MGSLNHKRGLLPVWVLAVALLVPAACGRTDQDAQGAITPGKDRGVAGQDSSASSQPLPAPALPARNTVVEAVRVAAGDFTLTATYIGHLLPRERVQLRAEVEGMAERVTFEEGDAVSASSVLANISTEQFSVRRDRARSDLELAESNYRRDVTLAEKKLIPATRLDDSRNRRDVARYEVKLAQIDLEKSAVRTPISGIVKTKGVERGEFLSKGDLIAEILDIAKVRALFNVPEREIRFLKPGSTVSVSLDALPEARYSGEVALVGLEADLSSRTFPVEVELDNPRRELRPGMLVRALVELATYRDQVLIPRHAVLEREHGRAVFVADHGRALERAILTGAGTGEQVQVVEGLAPGDLLIVTGHQRLINDEPVEVRLIAP